MVSRRNVLMAIALSYGHLDNHVQRYKISTSVSLDFPECTVVTSEHANIKRKPLTAKEIVFCNDMLGWSPVATWLEPDISLWQGLLILLYFFGGAVFLLKLHKLGVEGELFWV